MTSIFRLEEVRAYENDEQLYQDASIGILGHYSSLGNALDAIHRNNKETYEPDDIYAYLIKEVAVDGEVGESDCLSIRSYDAKGTLVDECLQNYNLANQYEGRNPDTIRFRVGDIVEVLEGHRLYSAIVAALPPTPADNIPILDAMDDCYMVLPRTPNPSATCI